MKIYLICLDLLCFLRVSPVPVVNCSCSDLACFDLYASRTRALIFSQKHFPGIYHTSLADLLNLTVKSNRDAGGSRGPSPASVGM
jgi:hypothetical protein